MPDVLIKGVDLETDMRIVRTPSEETRGEDSIYKPTRKASHGPQEPTLLTP